MSNLFRGVAAVGVLSVLVGCATTDTRVSNSVFATHRIVNDLKKDVGPSVERLNETTADLIARVEASDTQMRGLQGMLEENQHKIDGLDRKLSELIRALYAQLGLTPPTPYPASTVSPSGPAVISPPSTPSEAGATDTGIRTGLIPEETMEQLSNERDGSEPDLAASEADYRKAQQAYVNDDWQSALQLYTDYLSRYPNGRGAGNAQFWKAECYRRLKQYEQAIQEFESFHENHNSPDNTKIPMAINYRAECHLALGQTARAVALFKEVLDKYPMSYTAASRAESRLKSLQDN